MTGTELDGAEDELKLLLKMYVLRFIPERS